MSPLRVNVDSEIHVHLAPTALAKELKAALTLSNPEYESAVRMGRSTRNIPRKLRIYSEVNGTLSLPRGFWNDFVKMAHRHGATIDCADASLEFDSTPPPQDLSMWDYQEPWIEGLLSSNQGVGIAPPGSGKTIMGLEAYARLGQPCLWLTHTKRLARQAAKRAETFLGVKAGMVGMGKEHIEHFTVGLVPTLVKRDLSKYKDLFGMVIVDECHHVPARTFLEVISAFDARYRYGLTATPYRDDRLEELIFLTLGPELAYLDKQILRNLGKLMTPTIVRRPTKFNFPYNPRAKKFNYMALADALAHDKSRNQQIASDVILESCISDDNVCIVLVGRIPHGDNLKELIAPIIPGVDFVHSKQSDKQSDGILEAFENGELRVLIATYRMLAEGFDYQPSNRLFLTAPFKGRTLIEQACGRIERTFPGKADAIVYDYIDPLVRVLEKQSEVRLDIYEANENPVRTMT